MKPHRFLTASAAILAASAIAVSGGAGRNADPADLTAPVTLVNDDAFVCGLPLDHVEPGTAYYPNGAPGKESECVDEHNAFGPLPHDDDSYLPQKYVDQLEELLEDFYGLFGSESA